MNDILIANISKLLAALLGASGLFLLLKTLGLHHKYQDIKEIPQNFIKNYVKFNGKISAVEDESLFIQHIPTLNLFSNSKNEDFFILKLWGLIHTSESKAYLTKLIGSNISFQIMPLIKTFERSPNVHSCLLYHDRNFYFKFFLLNRVLLQKGLSVCNDKQIKDTFYNELNEKDIERYHLIRLLYDPYYNEATYKMSYYQMAKIKLQFYGIMDFKLSLLYSFYQAQYQAFKHKNGLWKDTATCKIKNKNLIPYKFTNILNLFKYLKKLQK